MGQQSVARRRRLARPFAQVSASPGLAEVEGVLTVRRAEPWMRQAACLDDGLEVGFLGQSTEAQLRVCDDCPVWVDCLFYAERVRLVGCVAGGREIKMRPVALARGADGL
jgi:hypothetical protein